MISYAQRRTWRAWARRRSTRTRGSGQNLSIVPTVLLISPRVGPKTTTQGQDDEDDRCNPENPQWCYGLGLCQVSGVCETLPHCDLVLSKRLQATPRKNLEVPMQCHLEGRPWHGCCVEDPTLLRAPKAYPCQGQKKRDCRRSSQVHGAHQHSHNLICHVVMSAIYAELLEAAPTDAELQKSPGRRRSTSKMVIFAERTGAALQSPKTLAGVHACEQQPQSTKITILQCRRRPGAHVSFLSRAVLFMVVQQSIEERCGTFGSGHEPDIYTGVCSPVASLRHASLAATCPPLACAMPRLMFYNHTAGSPSWALLRCAH